MQGVPYRGYLIQPCSYEALTEDWKPRGWVPKANVVRPDGGGIRTTSLVYPREDTFATREEADGHAVEMAKGWIDRQG